MALTNNLLAGLLARASGETHETTAAVTRPRRRSEDDDQPQTPFAVTQDVTLGFDLQPDEGAFEAAAQEPPAITTPANTPPAHGHSSQGTLLQLLKRLTLSNTPQQLVKEFRWQQQASGDTTKFRDEVLGPSARPKVFGFTHNKSPFIHVIHSPARFFDLDAAAELQGKVIAFVGDRTTFGQPHPVALPERNAWEWKTAAMVNDPVRATTFFSVPGREKEFWRPEGVATAPVALPRLLLLPTPLAAYASESPRTPWELFKFVGTLLENTPEGGPTEDDTALIRLWLMGNLQAEANRTASAWVLELQPVVATDQAFTEWCFHHLSSILGTSPAQHTQIPTTGAGPTPLETSITRMAQVVERLATGTAATTHPSQQKESTTTIYTDYQVAVIKGYCGLRDTGAIPIIWALFQTTKHTEDHRLNLEKKMREWSTLNGIEIDHGVFFSKETIEDIVKLRPNPGDGHPTLKTAERGVSILACLPRSQNEIETIRIREQAAEESKTNRTLAEALKLAAMDSRQPASGSLELKLNIATYLAKLWALFGETCHLYQKVAQIHQLFRQPAVMAAKHAFTPLLCRQITWAIYEDSRQFFATRLHPDDFKPGAHISFPISLLDDVMGDVRYQRPVLRSSFPLAWMEIPPKPSLSQLAPAGLSPFSGGRADGSEASAGAQTTDKLAHIHPTIRAALKEYHTKFSGRVMMQRVLEHANLTFKDLPFLTPLVDSQSGKNWLCYNHCLGICQHGKQCIFRRRNGHVDGSTLPQEFATALVNKIRPGIAYMLKAEYPARGASPTRKQPAPGNNEGGNATKRQRRDE
jgi:hypothetical protein